MLATGTIAGGKDTTLASGNIAGGKEATLATGNIADGKEATLATSNIIAGGKEVTLATGNICGSKEELSNLSTSGTRVITGLLAVVQEKPSAGICFNRAEWKNLNTDNSPNLAHIDKGKIRILMKR